jgi:hypothetical protein
MYPASEVTEHAFVDVAELVPHRAPDRPADVVQDHVHLVGGQGAPEQPPDGMVAADQPGGAAQALEEVVEQSLDGLARDAAEARHRLRDVADLFEIELGEQSAGVFLAGREHEHRRLLRAVQSVDAGAARHCRSYSCSQARITVTASSGACSTTSRVRRISSPPTRPWIASTSTAAGAS